MDISSNEIIHSGILRKKGGRLNVWSDRYFSLKSNALYYYLRSSDNVRIELFLLFVVIKYSLLISDKLFYFVL